ncbi:DUF6907 domain-containing protein [Streptomyces sp. NPDC127103]|uniref:DUF6907 domain-containing protein n=1 Tax=Streptomyces sp. NPDC127103 TaxID=3347139 RepID=UPI0036560424
MPIIADTSGAGKLSLGQQGEEVPATPADEAGRVARQIAVEVLAKTPALAARIGTAEFTEIVGLALRDTVDQYKRTASERGPVWMARYGCPTWCVLDHAGKDREPGWHQGPAIAMDPPPLQDDDRAPRDVVPFLTARINQANESPEIFGVKTTLWLDINDDTHELDIEGASRFIERMERFLPRLKAMRDRLAEAGRNDQPRNEEAYQAWRTEPLVPAADRLSALCTEQEIRIIAADGPSASDLTEGVLLAADDTHPRRFITPPGQSAGRTLAQLRRALVTPDAQ